MSPELGSSIRTAVHGPARINVGVASKTFSPESFTPKTPIRINTNFSSGFAPERPAMTAPSVGQSLFERAISLDKGAQKLGISRSPGLMGRQIALPPRLFSPEPTHTIPAPRSEVNFKVIVIPEAKPVQISPVKPEVLAPVIHKPDVQVIQNVLLGVNIPALPESLIAPQPMVKPELKFQPRVLKIIEQRMNQKLLLEEETEEAVTKDYPGKLKLKAVLNSDKYVIDKNTLTKRNDLATQAVIEIGNVTPAPDEIIGEQIAQAIKQSEPELLSEVLGGKGPDGSLTAVLHELRAIGKMTISQAKSIVRMVNDRHLPVARRQFGDNVSKTQVQEVLSQKPDEPTISLLVKPKRSRISANLWQRWIPN